MSNLSPGTSCNLPPTSGNPVNVPPPAPVASSQPARGEWTVTLSLVVDSEGHPRNVHVVRSLGMGLDEKAIEAVSKWRFEPGLKNGYPVAVQIAVEVVFRLY